jgi:hypothetical protein
LKGVQLRTVITFLIVLCLGILTGCAPKGGTIKTAVPKQPKVLLTVDFNDTQTLRCKFVSHREIAITWEPSKTGTEQAQPTIGNSSETMEMVVSYTPLKINTYGLTTIKATIDSVQVRRSDDTRPDAVEQFAGKAYTFKVGPTGKIEDNSQLNALIKQVGEKAFRPDTSKGRIKEPDMIGDFVATQWFLWDAISSIKNPSQGVSIGQTWQSKLSVPTPMVMRQARDVTYRLREIRRSDNDQIAVIDSIYSKSDSTPQSWPVPYSGRFQMSGRFGFLGNYQLLDLKGRGEELFNVTLGRTEQYTQHYEMLLQASIPLGIGENPTITIIQNLTMNLLDD